MRARPAKKRRKRPMDAKDVSRLLVDRMTEGALTREKREPTLQELAQVGDAMYALTQLIARDGGAALREALGTAVDEGAKKKQRPRKSKRASASKSGR